MDANIYGHIMKPKPICITSTDGSQRWVLDGKIHREDGPALEFISGTKAWYKQGHLHRIDGPAVEYAYGDKEWYINGIKYYTKQDYYRELVKRGICTEEDAFLELL
jgi:hypothetical protein